MATEATVAIEVDSVVILVAEIAADLVVLPPGLEEAALADRRLAWADRRLELAGEALAVLRGVLAVHRAVSLEALAAAIAKADSAQ